MKHFKRLFSYLVALTMVLSLAAFAGVNVHAAGGTTTYKLTLTGTATGHTYEAYQVFTGDLSTNTDGDKVLSNVKWGTGITYKGTESAADVAKALGDGTTSIAQLQEKLTLTTPIKTVTSSEGSTVIDSLAAGYYLVKDKDGTQATKSDAYTKFIVQVVGNTEAAIKSDVPTVEKKVKDTNDSTDETSGWQDSADYDVGDTVPYQITGTMPDNIADYTTYKYVFTDTMSKGLTYDGKAATATETAKRGNAKITIGKKDVTSSFEETVTANTDGTTTVTWACDNLKGIEGVNLKSDTKVVVNYTCQLNDQAVPGAAGNPNTVDLTYSNNPNKGGEGETGKTPEDKNIVFTYKVVVNKVNETNKPLAGADFTLSKVNADNTSTVVKTFTLTGNAETDPTTFTASGLDDGTYVLKETKTPSGYNTIADQYFTITAEHDVTSDDPTLSSLSGDKLTGSAQSTITFTANKDADSLTTNVVNEKGSNLPSTGGMGTTLLYVAGGILVACAAAYVIISRKKSAKK